MADFLGTRAKLEELIAAATKFESDDDQANTGSELDITPPKWTDDRFALEAVAEAHGEFHYVAELGKWVVGPDGARSKTTHFSPRWMRRRPR